MGWIIDRLLSAIGAVGDVLTKVGRFFEAAFFWVLDRMGRLASIDRLLSWVLFLLLAPFRWLGDAASRLNRTEGWLVAGLGFLLWPFLRAFELLDRGTGRRERRIDRRRLDAEDRALERRLARREMGRTAVESVRHSWLSRVVWWVFEPVRGSFFFLGSLLRSRRTGFWVGSAILLGLVGLCGGAWYVTQSQGRSGMIARYEAALKQAIETGDEGAEELYRLKLAQLGDTTERGQFQAAIALADRGDLSGAYDIMVQLAPVDRPGFPGAHFWIAQQLVNQAVPAPPYPADLELALTHLEHVRSRMGDEPPLRLLTGIAELRLGRVEAAANTLTPLSGQELAADFLLMELWWREGDRESAQRHARQVTRQVQQWRDRGQSVEPAHLQWQAAAAQVLGDVQQVTQSAEAWYAAEPESPEAKRNRVALLLTQLDRWLMQPDPGQTAELAERVRSVLQDVPEAQRPQVAGLLTKLHQKARVSTANSDTGANARSKAGATAVAELKARLTGGPLPGLVWEALGTAAAMEQDWATAESLLAKATDVDPTWAVAWNNRAYVIDHGLPARRQEALAYADKAVALKPLQPDFRETRGMILYHLGQYALAVEDLELASNGSNDLKSVHLTLADCYRRLGNESLAVIHERQAR